MLYPQSYSGSSNQFFKRSLRALLMNLLSSLLRAKNTSEFLLISFPSKLSLTAFIVFNTFIAMGDQNYQHFTYLVGPCRVKMTTTIYLILLCPFTSQLVTSSLLPIFYGILLFWTYKKKKNFKIKNLL